MKAFGLFLLLFLIGTATLVYLSDSSKGNSMLNSGMVSISSNGMTLTMFRRKLKANMDPPSKDRNKTDAVQLEDYRPIDPIPSSTNSIKPAPIQHGTPLMPYIPGPSPPPGEERHGESP